jgi:membrane fusion protein, multidrug efflux system
MNPKKISMTRRIILTIFCLLFVAGVIGGVKALQIRRMIASSSQFVMPPETVTTAVVQADRWETMLTAPGTLEAVQGVTVAAEQSGKVVRLDFTPGSFVQKGALLVQLDTTAERAQLRALESTAALARINLERMVALAAKGLIAQADYDTAQSALEQAEAQADQIRAAIAKKTIRAPFAGRLGIRLVNLGQMLREGEPIVSLQVLDPIFVNFLLPQQEMSRIAPGLPVRLSGEVLGSQEVTGKITAINPEIDAATRSVRIQATIANPDERLRPGMFVNAALLLNKAEEVLTIPATAVLHAPYSDSVFVVEANQEQDATSKTLRQQFVRLGVKKGDFVAVLSGLTEGQTVVSTGVFKLRHGQAVVEDNSLSPEFKLEPAPENN